jgi:hypothetical protein
VAIGDRAHSLPHYVSTQFADQIPTFIHQLLHIYQQFRCTPEESFMGFARRWGMSQLTSALETLN